MKSKENHLKDSDHPEEGSSSKLPHQTLVSPIKPELPAVPALTSAGQPEASSGFKPASAPTITSILRPGIHQEQPAAPLTIPPILLEGDHPGQIGMPGESTQPARGQPSAEKASDETPMLPEAYGTGELVLTARDPHWLYAHWDFTAAQRRQAAADSREGHLTLRLHPQSRQHASHEQFSVPGNCSHKFIHVGPAGGSFVAELGYYRSDGAWTELCRSGVASTPPTSASSGSEPSFATLPFDVPMTRLLELSRGALQTSGGLAVSVEQLRREGHPDLPPFLGSAEREWTQEQESVLAGILAIDSPQRRGPGSQDIPGLVQGPLSSEAPSSPSSPFGGWGESSDFWFDINAELVLYGSTEPGATVTIGGRRIKLREDGSFTFRFSLPDGAHELSVTARSASGNDARRADLKFSRTTNISGAVGAHRQDPSLKPPRPESLND